MIRGIPSSTNVMVALAQAPFDFHLTGSRAFGYEAKKSDWDFFVGIPEQGIMTLRTWLTSNGFRPEPNSRYQLPTIGDLHSAMEVWIHPDGNVHIQVVRDPVTKAEVQKVVKDIQDIAANLGRLDKATRSLVWKVAHSAYDAGRKKVSSSLPGFRAG